MAEGESFCTKCEKVKPIDAFSRNRRMPGGVHLWCKACVREHCTEPWRRANYRRALDRVALHFRRRRGLRLDTPIKAKVLTWEERRPRAAAAGP